eukprot:1159978-Pelagomonas_calceolata.AAC.2
MVPEYVNGPQPGMRGIGASRGGFRSGGAPRRGGPSGGNLFYYCKGNDHTLYTDGHAQHRCLPRRFPLQLRTQARQASRFSGLVGLRSIGAPRRGKLPQFQNSKGVFKIV